MRIFGKNDKKTITELEDYYANKHGKGMAWAMLLLSLLVTLTVLSGMFFGGRWLYGALTSSSSDGDKSTTIVIKKNSDVETDKSINNDSEKNNDTRKVVVTESPTPTEGTVSDEAARTSVPSQLSSPVQATSENDSTIPDTGAGHALILTPLLVVVLGYLFSIKRQLN